MTITAYALVNPGAESGVTGWTKYNGGNSLVNTGGAHTGTKAFDITGFNTGHVNVGQQIAVDAGHVAAIAAGYASIRASMWQGGSDTGFLYVSYYQSDGTTLIRQDKTETLQFGPYTKREFYARVPAGTAFFRIGFDTPSPGASHSNAYDDFELDFTDDWRVDWPWVFTPHAYQLGTYAVGIYPSAQARATQLPIMALAASEESNDLYKTFAHQLGAYALVRGVTDRRDLRAWPFTQDDHDFYVLQLGAFGTLVYDKLTGQWAQWKSASKAFWRGNDGVAWEGMNICCDTESGILWEIDPTGRLDEDDTPITSVVSGRVQTRMRKNAQCHMAELAVSEQEPPAGIDASTLTITLRTSDDDGHSFVNHGSVTGEDVGDDITVRWYGLGLMPAPGRVFEITDTGYARRIDGFNIEVGGVEQ